MDVRIAVRIRHLFPDLFLGGLNDGLGGIYGLL